MTNSALRKSDAKPAADSVSRWKANYCNDLEGNEDSMEWVTIPLKPVARHAGRDQSRSRFSETPVR